ncbi:hypothetical protein [Roseivirga misakiensis]|uniref:Macroglobulin domain-containing protein n=1 Tax=Roseivirga misakiensis TaxID=1563681 RepID=A0A1E5T5J9_9BACT|nr:hypothetical protein [Roseivirga misakiensis]OEK06664.1 hypothetical protein BFP71_03085 [Roseivirga misakiensis]
MEKKNLFTALIFLAFSTALIAQNSSDIRSARALEAYQEALPTEKLFVHLNKTEFAERETIWIKTYLMAGADHLPSPLSRTIYLELLNANGSIVERITAESIDGFGQTSIEIDSLWTQGDYYLRGYTNWMKNQDESFFFQKKIKILSIDPSQSVLEQTNAPQPIVRFYPEGGNLVKGLQSWLAYEVKHVMGDTIYGKIYDQNDALITSFKTEHEGRGRIRFLPMQVGYYARIDNMEGKWPLPAVSEKGTVMTTNTAQEEDITLTFSSTLPGKYTLLAHTRGEMAYRAMISLKDKKERVTIPKNTLEEGITAITLFNENQLPVAERLVFINHNRGLDISVNTDKQTYKKRELVDLEISVKDSFGRPIQGSFSLTATNKALVQNDQHNYNIRAYQLLKSDLKGHIKNPSQYFENTTLANQRADLLMMVNGWRRFNWDEVFIDNLPEPTHFVEQGLTVSGRLYRNGKDIVKDGQVFMFSSLDPNESKDLQITNEKGEFTFTNKVFNDSTEITIQGFHKNGRKNINLALDSSKYDVLPLTVYNKSYTPPDTTRLFTFKEYMITSVRVDTTYRRENGVILLGDVVVTAKDGREAVLNQRENRSMNVLMVEDLPYEEKQNRDAFDIMLGRVGGFMLLASNGPNGVEIGIPVLGMGRWQSTPAIFLDGQEVEYTDVQGISATRIQYIGVYKAAGPPGAVYIYTLPPEIYYASIPKGPSYFTGKLPGYHVGKEFYKPIHDGSEEGSFKPDMRNTLHWEPNIVTDKDGKAKLSFYTSDDLTEIAIDIQGVAVDGVSGFGSSSFTVKK